MSASNHGDSVKAILYAFLANLGLAIAKTGAAMYTGSGSMMAEAIHPLAQPLHLNVHFQYEAVIN